jgi:hypothetical protein
LNHPIQNISQIIHNDLSMLVKNNHK